MERAKRQTLIWIVEDSTVRSNLSWAIDCCNTQECFLVFSRDFAAFKAKLPEVRAHSGRKVLIISTDVVSDGPGIIAQVRRSNHDFPGHEISIYHLISSPPNICPEDVRIPSDMPISRLLEFICHNSNG